MFANLLEIHSYSSFILAIILFQLFPGAGTIVILRSTAANGVKSGMCAVWGTLLGDFIFMSSAVLGLATVLVKFPLLFKFIQYLGILYLCYLGLQKLVEKVDQTTKVHNNKNTHYTAFKEALAVCLTNPKAIMFFMAFFPLFLSLDSNPIALVVMMLHVTTISLVYQTLLVVVGNRVSRYISGWKYAKVLGTRLAGIAFIAFGVKLAKNINS